jgi:ABC-type cobalamin/Fe3+-siderophores transport system ATPase subunit
MAKRSSIGIVGPCGSGKTTLISSLNFYNINSKHIVQEHSYVKDMWRRLTNPDILIYLDVNYEKTIQRKNLDWSRAEFETQIQRLQHAKTHANLIIDTTNLTEKEVLEAVLNFLVSTSIIETVTLH